MVGVDFNGEPFGKIDPSVIALYEGVNVTWFCSQSKFCGFVGGLGGLAYIVDSIRVEDVFCV